MTTQKGLTLLEVLVALMVLAVALTAIIKATTENIHATSHLQAKTQATWVGLKLFNQARLRLIQLPLAPEHQDFHEFMLGQQWEAQGFLKKTRNPRIQEVHIQVFHLPDHHLLTDLTSYLYGV
ncbi:MAG TPA: type II secretion system minor pseudopilin GspI [Gammaproteobacteria bacterium]|nr:type II secretion system minor pseudopilin GspI [Gammaproteobacteria bacterium]